MRCTSCGATERVGGDRCPSCTPVLATDAQLVEHGIDPAAYARALVAERARRAAVLADIAPDRLPPPHWGAAGCQTPERLAWARVVLQSCPTCQGVEQAQRRGACTPCWLALAGP